jgi:hypothetical protein
MLTKITVFVIALIVAAISVDANDDEKRQPQIVVERINYLNVDTPQLNMTLCVNKCAGEKCKSYITPIDVCYSSSLLFPNDPSWSGNDFRDEVIGRTQTLFRTIFDTEDSTCRGASDTFRIPLNKCVGPFGKPRPWGSFSIIQEQSE